MDKLLNTHKKRLKILELQAANFGISTPAHIIIEIDDINDKISSIESKSVKEQELSDNHVRSAILFLSANPINSPYLRLNEEYREIEEKLQIAEHRHKFTLYQKLSARPSDISQAILDIHPRIVHFSGHGTSTGKLCFEKNDGKIHPISAEALSALFEVFSDEIECVVLNACYSKIQAIAISKHIDYVIGMDAQIGDKAAIAFSIGFYQALLAERSIEESYKLGCIQIKLYNIPESLTPSLQKKYPNK